MQPGFGTFLFQNNEELIRLRQAYSRRQAKLNMPAKRHPISSISNGLVKLPSASQSIVIWPALDSAEIRITGTSRVAAFCFSWWHNRPTSWSCSRWPYKIRVRLISAISATGNTLESRTTLMSDSRAINPRNASVSASSIDDKNFFHIIRIWCPIIMYGVILVRREFYFFEKSLVFSIW
jgi:hypothetical protein